MAKLKYLEIVPGDLVEDPHRSGVKFPFLSHHVKEIFVEYLGKEFVLDGSQKIRITCGPIQFGMNQLQPQTYETSSGCSSYVVEAFDFDGFYSLPDADQDHWMLNVIKESFLDIAKRVDCESEIENRIESAVEKTIECRFALELPVNRLGKKKRDVTTSIIRCLDRVNGERWCLDLHHRGSERSYREWIGPPGFIVRSRIYHKAKWVGDNYCLTDNFGKTIFSKTYDQCIRDLDLETC